MRSKGKPGKDSGLEKLMEVMGVKFRGHDMLLQRGSQTLMTPWIACRLVPGAHLWIIWLSQPGICFFKQEAQLILI